jgi:hypothetical protein
VTLEGRGLHGAIGATLVKSHLKKKKVCKKKKKAHFKVLKKPFLNDS